MTDFDKYKHLYYGDFDTSYTNFPSNLGELSYNVAREQNNKFEKEIYNLIEFIRLWKDRYELFCQNFDAYYYTTQNMPVWSMDKSERGYVPLPKSEFYIDEFFNMILNKRAKFEIQQYRHNYRPEYDNSGRLYEYSKQPDQNIFISGNKFTIIGKDNNYRLDIKMNAALICSLIGAISNNQVIHQWYSKQSNFKKFVEKISNEFKYLSFEISNRKTTRIKLSSGIEDMLVDIDTSCGWCYLIYRNEVVKIENNLGYNHLDKLFGKDRKEPLTEEDLQLYSIVNEGRKPIMYDFEF
ncbi:hypothetical protein phiA019_0054 [Aeromonas phage phiA019]|nr:hypothetical protein phiA009_0058 [Aeromonas phage phiA009]ULG01591.1 hypothetical protein phiA019_0054 [Aeromonas phage phiA019]